MNSVSTLTQSGVSKVSNLMVAVYDNCRRCFLNLSMISYRINIKTIVSFGLILLFFTVKTLLGPIMLRI
jgi:hypothetical protein